MINNNKKKTHTNTNTHIVRRSNKDCATGDHVVFFVCRCAYMHKHTPYELGALNPAKRRPHALSYRWCAVAACNTKKKKDQGNKLFSVHKRRHRSGL